MTIEGGYYIKARQIMNNTIMNFTPCARELWDFLINNAAYFDRKVNGINLSRGQLHISINEITEALSWQIGYRRESYTPKQMKDAMKVLRRYSMIVSTKVPAGMLITVCNYDYYQDPKNYEGTNEGTNEGKTKVPRRYHQPSETPTDKGAHAVYKKDKKEKKDNIESQQKNSAVVVSETIDLNQNSKEKEQPAGGAPKIFEVVMPFDTVTFSEAWDLWKRYKKEQHRFNYKSIGEQAALKDLAMISSGSEAIAIELIYYAMAKGWKGIYRNEAYKKDKRRTGASGEDLARLLAAQLGIKHEPVASYDFKS